MYIASCWNDRSPPNLFFITFRPEETLFLEVTAAAIRPSLVIASDDGSNVVDFKRVGIRDSAIRTVVLKNITNDTLTVGCYCLCATALHTYSPFMNGFLCLPAVFITS